MVVSHKEAIQLLRNRATEEGYSSLAAYWFDKFHGKIPDDVLPNHLVRMHFHMNQEIVDLTFRMYDIYREIIQDMSNMLITRDEAYILQRVMMDAPAMQSGQGKMVAGKVQNIVNQLTIYEKGY